VVYPSLNDFSNPACERPYDDSRGARPAKGFRAFVDGGAGRQNIINDQDRAVLEIFWVMHGKGSAHVAGSLRPMQFGLGLGCSNAPKMIQRQRQAEAGSNVMGQEQRLVEFAHAQACRMQRHGQREIDMRQSLSPDQHQVGERAGERDALAIFEEVNGARQDAIIGIGREGTIESRG
jgi:hypothetical protein